MMEGRDGWWMGLDGGWNGWNWNWKVFFLEREREMSDVGFFSFPPALPNYFFASL